MMRFSGNEIFEISIISDLGIECAHVNNVVVFLMVGKKDQK